MTTSLTESSVIASASAQGRDLVVEFKKSGKTYTYHGAGHHEYDLTRAPSAGKYFNANVKNNYDCTLSG